MTKISELCEPSMINKEKLCTAFAGSEVLQQNFGRLNRDIDELIQC
jgi:hypothetical protein